MKRKLLLSLSLLVGLGVSAQNTLGEIFDAAKDRIKISGYGQAGYSYEHINGDKTENTFDLKRANITIEARISDRWTATFTPEFNGGKVLELYTDFTVFPSLKFKAGQFKTPFSIENKYSSSVIPLINGGSAAMRYLVGTDDSNPMFKGSGGRDLGFMMYGNLLYGIFTYELAVMNGRGISVKDNNNAKDFVGRLTLNAGDNLAVSGSTMIGTGCNVGQENLGVLTDQNFTRNRWSIGADYKSQLIDLRFEYLAGKDNKTKSQGAYITGIWHAFDKFDVVGSVDYFNKNKDLSDKQWNFIGGVQYWFHRKCRLQAQYVYSDNHLGRNQSAIMTQLQVGF